MFIHEQNVQKNTFDQIFKSCSSVYRIIFLYTNAIPCLTEKTLLIFCSYNSGDQTLSEIQRFMIDEICPFYSSKFIIDLEYDTPCRYFFFIFPQEKRKMKWKNYPNMFLYSQSMANFEAVHWNIPLSINVLFLKSAGAIINSHVLMRIIFKVVLKKNSLCYKMCAHS